jgi:23S rRNA pseudouridine1911/1915/1917 synthase
MMAAEIHELVVSDEGIGDRLDRYLAEVAGLVSRSQLKQRMAALTVNGKPAKLSRLVESGDRIRVELAPLPETNLEAEDLDLDILFENDDVVVINKPAGLVVHPAAGNQTGTLVHGLLHHFGELKEQDFEDEARPGIVHRLDKDTSGVMIVAKHPAAHEWLAAQFQARTTKKTYLAIASGASRAATRHVEGFIRRDPANRQRFMHHASEGKAASTDFDLLASGGQCCLYRVRPLTGRTHQIRVHARHLGQALLGDPIYGKPDKRFPGLRLMLHAWRLEICLPGEGEPRRFEAPVPPDFLATARALGLAEGLERA